MMMQKFKQEWHTTFHTLLVSVIRSHGGNSKNYTSANSTNMKYFFSWKQACKFNLSLVEKIETITSNKKPKL